jgi:hypothetical protein
VGVAAVVGDGVGSGVAVGVATDETGSPGDVCDVIDFSAVGTFVTGVAFESDATVERGLSLLVELLVAGAPTLVAVAGPILSSNPSSEPLTFR